MEGHGNEHMTNEERLMNWVSLAWRRKDKREIAIFSEPKEECRDEARLRGAQGEDEATDTSCNTGSSN